MKDKKKRASIYTRVSTQDQDCQRQVSDLIALADRAGYEVVQVFQEKASGAKNDRAERAKVMKLAQSRKIDLILVTELSRWGRSTQDLLATMQDLLGWGVSIIASSGMQMDLSTPSGKLMATVLSGVAEFERELIQERVRSGIAAAKARGKKMGRQAGDNYKSGKVEDKIIALTKAGKSCRQIAEAVGISKTAVNRVVQRTRPGA